MSDENKSYREEIEDGDAARREAMAQTQADYQNPVWLREAFELEYKARMEAKQEIKHLRTALEYIAKTIPDTPPPDDEIGENHFVIMSIYLMHGLGQYAREALGWPKTSLVKTGVAGVTIKAGQMVYMDGDKLYPVQSGRESIIGVASADAEPDEPTNYTMQGFA